MKDDATAALLVTYIHGISSSPAAVPRSSPLLLLLSAPPVEKTPRQTAAVVPALVPAMPFSSMVTSRLLWSKVPLLVGVHDETGELVVRMRGDDTGPVFFPSRMGVLGCG